jgi:hypothetical protein
MPVNKVRRLGSFAPLSANTYKNDALANAGEAAELLFYRALSFAADVLQDGFISDMQLARFPGAGMRDTKRRADKLCSVGLWVREDGGYRIVSWLKWNRSKAEIAELQHKDAGRKAPKGTPPSGGRKQPETESERNPDGIQTESESDSAGERNGFLPRARDTHTHTHTHTHTEPEPEPKPSSSSPAGSDFDRFYAAYPRKVGRKDAERKWTKAIKDGADPETVIAGAERYARQRAGQDQKFTKHPATWLHQGCWMDEDQTHLQLVSGGYQPFRNPTDQSVYEEDLL